MRDKKIKRYKVISNRYKAKDTGRIKAIRTISRMHLWKKFEEATHISLLGKYMTSVIKWIPCIEKMPNLNGKDGYNFLVIVKHRDLETGGWNYGIDLASYGGSYIDDFWNTCNDWCEGQEVHITHWATLELPKEILEKEGK